MNNTGIYALIAPPRLTEVVDVGANPIDGELRRHGFMPRCWPHPTPQTSAKSLSSRCAARCRRSS